MTAGSEFILGMLVLFSAFVFFTLIRNQVTFSVRDAFIDDDTLWPTAFDKLPEYDEMMLHPKHYHRWTKAQWVKYVDGK